MKVTYTPFDSSSPLLTFITTDASIQSPYSQRPPSPFNTNVSVHSVRSNGYRNQQPQPVQQPQQLPPQPQQTLRKKPPNGPSPTAAVGILRALDPHSEQPNPYHQPQQPREQPDDTNTEFSFTEDRHPLIKEEKKEKKGFWDRTKERAEEKERERQKLKDRERRQDDSQAELTRMIGASPSYPSPSTFASFNPAKGYLTATASEDWSLVLEVCERASATEAGAKETAKALRREFKYAEPPAQLSAARVRHSPFPSPLHIN